MVTCGVDNQPAALLLEDHHLQGPPGMLGVANALLGEASVPGLFAHEELEGLLVPLRDAASAEGAPVPTILQTLCGKGLTCFGMGTFQFSQGILRAACCVFLMPVSLATCAWCYC